MAGKHYLSSNSYKESQKCFLLATPPFLLIHWRRWISWKGWLTWDVTSAVKREKVSKWPGQFTVCNGFDHHCNLINTCNTPLFFSFPFRTSPLSLPYFKDHAILPHFIIPCWKICLPVQTFSCRTPCTHAFMDFSPETFHQQHHKDKPKIAVKTEYLMEEIKAAH